jgi:hypothetical protein
VTADATSSYFASIPPTFGWRRVVELADEFEVATAEMLAICDRLGVVVEDASEWLAPETVDLIRDVLAVAGPAAVLKPATAQKPAKPEKLRAVKPPKPEKAPKAQKVSKAAKRSTASRGSESPALASVSRDGVRTRRVVLIGLIIALLAAGTGVLVDQWVEYVTSTDAPATVVTTGER